MAVVLLSTGRCCSVLAGGPCALPGESEVGAPLWPGHWTGPGASGAASPGRGQCSRLPCGWPHPFSWQVQCGRGPQLEHTQLHQHLRVCGRAAERAGGGDTGHDVSDHRGGLWRGRPGPRLLPALTPTSPAHLPLRLCCPVFSIPPAPGKCHCVHVQGH